MTHTPAHHPRRRGLPGRAPLFSLLILLALSALLLGACGEEEGAGEDTPSLALEEDVEPGDIVTLRADVQDVIGDSALIIDGGFLRSEALILLAEGVAMPPGIEDGEGQVEVRGEVTPIEVPAIADDLGPLTEEELDALEAYSGQRAVLASAIVYAPEGEELAGLPPNGMTQGSDGAGELQPPGPDETPSVPRLTEADRGEERVFFVRIEERFGQRVHTVGDDVLLVIPGAMEVPAALNANTALVVRAEVAPITAEGLRAQYPELFDEMNNTLDNGSEFLAEYEDQLGLFARELLVVERSP